ncbi:MAG: hypothetical protein K0R14_686 [Burkholderiales bacterium]|jgi:hypothetical protein|nr:hypothetical protein [Burkholderiales bacterium]
MKTNKLNLYIIPGLFCILCPGINVAYAGVLQTGQCKFESEEKQQKLYEAQEARVNRYKKDSIIKQTNANVIGWTLSESDETDPTKRKMLLEVSWLDSDIQRNSISPAQFCFREFYADNNNITKGTRIALVSIKEFTAGNFIMPHKKNKETTLLKPDTPISFKMENPKKNVSNRAMQPWKMAYGKGIISDHSSFICDVDYPQPVSPPDAVSFHRSIPMPLSPSSAQPDRSQVSADLLEGPEELCITASSSRGYDEKTE